MLYLVEHRLFAYDGLSAPTFTLGDVFAGTYIVNVNLGIYSQFHGTRRRICLCPG